MKHTKGTILIICVMAFIAISAVADVLCSGVSAAIRVTSPAPDTVYGGLSIYASSLPGDGESVTVSVDGVCLCGRRAGRRIESRKQNVPDGHAYLG